MSRRDSTSSRSCVGPRSGKSRSPSPNDDGVDPQVELVDEVALEQPAQQDAAAMDLGSRPGFALSSRTAASRSPSMTWVFCHVGS